MTIDKERFDETFAHMLQEIIDDEGGVPPFLTVSLAANGAMIYERYDQLDDSVFAFKVLAKYLEPGAIASPLYITILDSAGKAWTRGINLHSNNLHS
jgi:hypothetical protein